MYDHLLFDADGTLLDFMSAEKSAVKRVLKELELPVKESIIASYSKINNDVWLEMEKGLLSIKELKVERFRRFYALYNLDKDPVVGSEIYSQFLSETYHLYYDAIEVLQRLKKSGIAMSLITNGIASVQWGRLKASAIREYFNTVVISEEIGIQKPDPRYFEITKEMVQQNGDKIENPLIIGDSLTSDIAGGIASGIDTCWINRFDMTLPENIKPTYQIKNLFELLKLLNLN
ncbi:MAG: YjjG family noncanonical pyrimidine nucleotidase [Sphaerochaetaceae bacterium]|jgi:2-haloacid dehalogenase